MSQRYRSRSGARAARRASNATRSSACDACAASAVSAHTSTATAARRCRELAAATAATRIGDKHGCAETRIPSNATIPAGRSIGRRRRANCAAGTDRNGLRNTDLGCGEPARIYGAGTAATSTADSIGCGLSCSAAATASASDEKDLDGLHPRRRGVGIGARRGEGYDVGRTGNSSSSAAVRHH